MRKAVLYSVAVVCLCLLFSLGGPSAQRMVNGDAGGGSTSPVAVSVANFPQVQSVQVDKTVNVTGSVAVTNLPPVQQVAGMVSVGNLPLDADGNLRTAAPQGSQRIHFIAYTQNTFPAAGATLLSLSNACQAEQPNSRMCNVQDFFESVPPPPAFPSTAVHLTTQHSGYTFYFPLMGCLMTDGSLYLGGCGTNSPYVVACCGY